MLKNKVNLSSLTKKGFIWSFIENFSKHGIHFITGIILARLLTPEDYGLIGMCAIFIAIGNSFVDSGFGIALIRKTKCTEEDYNTVFYFNIIISLIFYIILYFSSTLIAQFFNNEELINIIRLLGLGVIIGSFSLIQRTILTKEINFKTQTKTTSIALLSSGFVGVSMAFNGFGLWSLVAQSLAYSLFNAISLWLYNSWRPKFIFSKSSFNELFAFGSNLLITDLVDTIYKNIYYIIIGKFFSAASLGFFTRAENTVSLLTKNIIHTIKRVSYPVLSKLKDDDNALKAMYRKLVKNTMLITAFLILGLASSAKSFIFILIGEQWFPSVPYIQLLCFSTLLLPLTIFNLNAINVKGHSRLYLKLQMINKLIGIPVILIGIYVGINEMLIGFIIVSIIYYLINAYYSSKLINYTIREQLTDVIPILLVSSIVSFIVFQFNTFELNYYIIFSLQLISAFIMTIIFYNLIGYKDFLILQKKIIIKFKHGTKISQKN